MSVYPGSSLYPDPGLYPGTGMVSGAGGGSGDAGGTPLGPPGAFPMSQMATDAYEYLSPLAEQDPQNGNVLMILCGALGSAFLEAEQVARAQPGRAPYQQVYDIDRCPDFMLGWLGQFVGVPWIPYTDPVAKRLQVRAEPGFYRGRIDNLIAACEATQTQPNRLMTEERTPDAWGLTISYDPAYTPDSAAFATAAAAAVAWGLALTVTSSSTPLFEEGTLTFEGVAGTVTFESAVLTDIT